MNHPDFIVCNFMENSIIPKNVKKKSRRTTVVPTKRDSDIIFCLKVLSNTFTCTFHMS